MSTYYSDSPEFVQSFVVESSIKQIFSPNRKYNYKSVNFPTQILKKERFHMFDLLDLLQ